MAAWQLENLEGAMADLFQNNHNKRKINKLPIISVVQLHLLLVNNLITPEDA